ncbi:MAG: fructose PTS transporter subunit IIA [Candidatus Celaenobacter polaris]|nr:fructose PTS transporter subunit IIA [Candidatus Celaenobacter polaris]
MAQLIGIYKYMDTSRIIDITSDNKNDALKELAKVIGTSEMVTDEELFLKKIYEREKLMSTGIGYGIAVPHIRDASVKDFVIALGRKVEGLDYESIDNKPVKLIFMIGASEIQDKDYIRLLSRLVLRLKNRNFVKKLLTASIPEEIYMLIKDQD